MRYQISKYFEVFLHFRLLKGSCEAQFSHQGQNFVSNSRSDFWRKNILCDLKLMLHIINPQDTLLDLKIEEGKMSPLYTAQHFTGDRTCIVLSSYRSLHDLRCFILQIPSLESNVESKKLKMHTVMCYEIFVWSYAAHCFSCVSKEYDFP